jgi:hypothetical protein
MNSEKPIPEREIADLLPWYATGRLSESDRRRVADALASDPALRHEYDLVLEERGEVIGVNEALGAPSRQAADRFFAALDAEPRAPARRFDPAGALARWMGALRPRALAWATAAAAVVILVQAGFIATLVSERQPGLYGTASVPPDVEEKGGTELIVAFQPDAPAAAVAALLGEHKAAIVSGPAPGGLYRIRIAGEPLGKAETDALVVSFKGETRLVRLVAPAR